MATHTEREFEGRVVLITGAARNIGRAMAEMFAREGARVTLNARSSAHDVEGAAAAIAAAGGQALACIADITDPHAVKRMVDATLDKWGRLDILINNAVAHRFKPFAELTFDDWRATLAVTLDGAFHCVQACMPHLIRSGGGSIVNMGGAYGHIGAARRAATATSKAGLAGLTRALAAEFAVHDINVNCIAPGPANTERDFPFRFDAKNIPLGRFAESSEIAALVKLLCSREGRYITGQTIHVNGGLYMNN